MHWTVPNLLTVGRVLAAPLVAMAFVVFDRPTADRLALVLFVTASLTDFLDGWLARRWNQVSDLGRMLDPVADKAMVVIALATLIGLTRLDWLVLLPAVFILLREVLVSGLREFLGAVKLHVTPLAKWKTAVQMTAIALLFLAGSFTGGLADTLYGVGIVGLWLAAVLTVATGIDYFARAMGYLAGKGA
ncbi:CDP-diacylglycerol--glycerol-3-phosphate 3-phosphatidyltransferase [Paroceanicella profunda]|uniref:CDP-diacylglycerol--glycerol-3-phosphate 3-phosphatidyltransferase n=1 Tax=Paroceanicella profunda TaxID=2579971 RepID=A0A5B8G481_9RHOB|nr:CDP-diacylglycerol--glycerol-3-phosphate 3-phosphatidyltransferase [Paroceanicella profunda]